jgi:tRNA nucleotidyltransferase/poly(A) polymerase
MCQPQSEGGRRCNGHTPYGVARRNLQAQKQYHEHRLTDNQLTEKQRAKSEKGLEEAVNGLNELSEEKKALGTVKPYVMNLTPNTEKVLNQLEADGFTPYIVGGSVRDVIMGLDSKDVDIEVYGGQPESIAKSLKKIGHVDEVGKSFGVLKIAIDGEDFDVSLPRTDSKIGDGHKGFSVEVNPDLSLDEATARRDYTINALMYTHRLGFIVDKHGGLKDLENGQLRHVSEAFDEDPLRVLRGVQMASRFDMEMHPDTVARAQKLKSSFNDLATERVAIEFDKLHLKGKNARRAFKVLQATGWDSNFPGLAEINDEKLHTDLSNAHHVADRESLNNQDKTVLITSMITSKMNRKDREKFLKSTVIGEKTQGIIRILSETNLPEKQDSASMRFWADDLGKVSIRNYSHMLEAQGRKDEAKSLLAKAEAVGIADRAEAGMIQGRDVIARHPEVKTGPWLGKMLKAALHDQYNEKFRTQKQADQWLADNMPKFYN